jgi:hypothetical protein
MRMFLVFGGRAGREAGVGGAHECADAEADRQRQNSSKA